LWCILFRKNTNRKKNKLKENIKFLENIQNKFKESFELLKKKFENIEKDKEKLKLEISYIFTKIRNNINNREDELLLEVDKLYNSKYFSEDIIKEGEKLPKKIQLLIEKGNLIDKEWSNNNNNLYSYINDYINIENDVNTINIIEENINKCKINKNIKFHFFPKEEQINTFLGEIKAFGKLSSNEYKFKDCPLNIKEDKKYIFSGNNNNILTRINNMGWMGTICENELDKSIEEHKWKIKILKISNKYILVGVAPIDFDINTSNFNNCGYYLRCDSLTLFSGPPYNYNGKGTNLSKIDNEIIVVLNFKKRSLKFIINNEDKGDSYTNIPIDKPLFPAIFLGNAKDSVEIIAI